MTASTGSIPELLPLLQRYCALQLALVRELKRLHPTGVDWDYLIALPKHGEVVVADESWKFQVHGVGVTFIEPLSGLRVNCHVGVQDHAGAFDSGRVAEFLESAGQTHVRINNEAMSFGFSNGSQILAELCDRKLIKKCDDLPGHNYELLPLMNEGN